MDPKRLFATLRDAIRRKTFSRALDEHCLYICPDTIWVVYPEAFRTLSRRLGLAWNPKLGDRMAASLREHPDTLKWKGKDGVMVELRPAPDSDGVRLSLGISRKAVLGDVELSGFPVWLKGAKAVGMGPSEPSEWRDPDEFSRLRYASWR